MDANLNTITITQSATDIIAVKKTTLQDRIALIFGLMNSAFTDKKEAENTLKKVAVMLAFEALENGGALVLEAKKDAGGFLNDGKLSVAEIKFLHGNGFKTKHHANYNATKLVIERDFDLDDNIIFSAWELVEGVAVRNKRDSVKKSDALDIKSIKERFKKHGDLTKKQIEILFKYAQLS